MRVSAIYDIHGNLLTLAAVLQEIALAEFDQVVVDGVAVSMPREMLARLLNLDVSVQFIKRDADRESIAQIASDTAEMFSLMSWRMCVVG